jgi:uncharacterized protein YjiS (DUF1127 family)
MDTIDTIRCEEAGLHELTSIPSGRRGFVGRLVHVLRSFAKWIDRMLERRRSRLALLGMTDDQLKDIGISRRDALREGLRHSWD